MLTAYLFNLLLVQIFKTKIWNSSFHFQYFMNPFWSHEAAGAYPSYCRAKVEYTLKGHKSVGGPHEHNHIHTQQNHQLNWNMFLDTWFIYPSHNTQREEPWVIIVFIWNPLVIIMWYVWSIRDVKVIQQWYMREKFARHARNSQICLYLSQKLQDWHNNWILTM